MAKKYRIMLTDEQTRLVILALEEYFRLRMGQDFMLSDDLATMGVDLSPDNPNHDKIFDTMITRRDAINEVLRTAFRIAWPIYGQPKEKTRDMQNCEDIWEAIRVNKGMQTYPLYLSGEPIMEIETIGEDNHESKT